MLQFIKSNKMFSAATAVAIVFILAVLGYGFVAHIEIAMILGTFMLLSVIIYSLMLAALENEDSPY